jgi:hypothetical protein
LPYQVLIAVIAKALLAVLKEQLFRGDDPALAKQIEAGKVSETEGLKIVYGVNPGSSQAYRDVRALLKEAQAPEYPTLTQGGNGQK